MTLCTALHCANDADSVLVISAPDEPMRDTAICPDHFAAIASGQPWRWEDTAPGQGHVLLGSDAEIAAEVETLIAETLGDPAAGDAEDEAGPEQPGSF
jgi:hypothetical protein